MTPTDNASTNASLQSRDERVAALAYLIWEQEGRPNGKSEEHWLKACTIVDGEEASADPQGLPTWLNRAEPEAPAKSTASAVVEKMPQQARSKSAA